MTNELNALYITFIIIIIFRLSNNCLKNMSMQDQKKTFITALLLSFYLFKS